MERTVQRPPALPFLIAAGRVALGAAVMTAPGFATRAMTKDDSSTHRMLTRVAGIRDLALGAATVDALRHPDRARASRLLWLTALCDAADGMATLRHLPGGSRSRWAIAGTAWAAAALSAWEATRLTGSDGTGTDRGS